MSRGEKWLGTRSTTLGVQNTGNCNSNDDDEDETVCNYGSGGGSDGDRIIVVKNRVVA